MFNNFNSQWQGPYKYPSDAAQPYGMHTNIIRVTSLEEAIMRTTQPGSDMMYIHQDKDILYRVKVDFDGKKSWGEFPIVVPTQPDISPITKDEFKAILDRVEALEKKINPTEVDKDG